MMKSFMNVLLFFLQIGLSLCQKTGYNGTCNSTEECSDHRYTCQFDEENVLRCLCDRFHVWIEALGCVQIYNATEILSMTVTVTDNIGELEEQVNHVMKTQIAAGIFVLGMVIFATLAVTAFCVYVHVTDRRQTVPTNKSKRESQMTFTYSQKFSTSTSLV